MLHREDWIYDYHHSLKYIFVHLGARSCLSTALPPNLDNMLDLTIEF